MSTLLPFRGGDSSAESCFDVSDLLQAVAEDLEGCAVRRHVEIEVDAPPHAMVFACHDRLQQAFSHLLKAAIDCTRAGGEVVVTAYLEDDGVEVEIAEGGADMIDSPVSSDASPAVEDRLREVRRLLVADGVELEINACADGGTAYTVCFAAPGESPERGAQQAA